jgi:transposase
MFIRKKKNDSGKICVQVISKHQGKYKVLHTVGSSDQESQINQYVLDANTWIKSHTGALELDFTLSEQVVTDVLDNILSMKLVGYDLLLGPIFNEIGFSAVKDEYFRELVLARIAFPKSKLKTTEYLLRYKQIEWDEDQMYRYLDRLHNHHKEHVQRISYEHTKKLLGNDIGVVFYDVTTLYFEIDEEDELRKTGFSKEGKHQNPQIVLGLLVSKNGYPLAYEIFEGNKFEGHTMLPVIDAFKSKYNLHQLIIIADSGLLSNTNIEELQTKNYEFILGARIKNESKLIKENILSHNLKNGESTIIKKGSLKLIITYSDDRAKKDRYNREKGLRKLEKQIRRGRLTKANINNRGYNKFLRLSGEITVCIDQDKLQQDSQWDGLKGYLTNAKLSKDEILANYQHLWHIEKAFRVSKTDLKIRPIYHRLQRRIEAHICISFAAYKIYKELERQLKEKNTTMSPMKALEIAENIFEIVVEVKNAKSKVKKLLLLTEEQKKLAKLFNF